MGMGEGQRKPIFAEWAADDPCRYQMVVSVSKQSNKQEDRPCLGNIQFYWGRRSPGDDDYKYYINNRGSPDSIQFRNLETVSR